MPVCKPLLAAGALVPYGEDLSDDHHGDCWRGYHARDFAQSIGATSSRSFDARGLLIPFA